MMPIEPAHLNSLSGVSQRSNSQNGRVQSIADSLTDRQWDELTDVVLRRVERRIVDESARRGRFYAPKAR